MSGILDSKTRVLDSIITLEGRRQLANGGINIRYVTFTDSATFYAADIVSGSADATVRLYLEACMQPQDRVTFQADELGKLLPFDSAMTLGLRNGQLFDHSFSPPAPDAPIQSATSSYTSMTTVRGEQLQVELDGILTSSIDNFAKQRAIATIDTIFDDDGFAVGPKDVEFVLTNERPISNQSGYVANIEHLEDIYADPRMSHLPNFKFMPPINRIDDLGIDKTNSALTANQTLGHYTPWGRSHVDRVDHRTVLHEHRHYAVSGFSKTFRFDPTSRLNNLFIQAFEATNDTMFKLDIIDFGTFNSPPTVSSAVDSLDQQSATSQIFFVGKLMTKPETGTHTFVHLFTMYFG